MATENPIEASNKILREYRRKALKHVGKGALHIIEFSAYSTAGVFIAAKASELDTLGLVSGMGLVAGCGHIAVQGLRDAGIEKEQAIQATLEGMEKATDLLRADNEHAVDNKEEL